MKHEFLKKLVETPSPTGYEEKLQKLIYNHYKSNDITFLTDTRSTLTGIYNKDLDFKVMLMAHADEIGLVVTGYNPDGSLQVEKNGGIKPSLYIGQRVSIICDDVVYNGVMGVNDVNTNKEKVSCSDLFVDLGFENKEEAASYIKLGSHIIHNEKYDYLNNNLVCARAFDDRVGAYIIHEAALKAYKKSSCQILVSTSTGEENTGRGAYSVSCKFKPDVAIVVDVTYASDYYGAICNNNVLLGKGGVICKGSIINKKLNQMLEQCAKELEKPVQFEVWQGKTGTDGDTILKTNEDVAIVLFSLPLRYMHSPVEVISLSDVESMIDVLALFLERINSKTNLKSLVLEE